MLTSEEKGKFYRNVFQE